MCEVEFYSTNIDPEEIRAVAYCAFEDGLEAIRYKYDIFRFVSKWKYQYPIINIVHDLYITLDLDMVDYFESLRCKLLIIECASTFEDVPIKTVCKCDMDGLAFMLARLSKETDEKAAYNTIKEFFEYEKGRKGIEKGTLEIQVNTDEEETLYPMLYEKAHSFLLSNKSIKLEEKLHCEFYLESFYHVWNVKQYQKFIRNDFGKLVLDNKADKEDDESTQEEQNEKGSDKPYTENLIKLFHGNTHLVDELFGKSDDEKAACIKKWAKEGLIEHPNNHLKTEYAKALKENDLIKLSERTFRDKL